MRGDQGESEWISVKKRLPRPGQRVVIKRSPFQTRGIYSAAGLIGPKATSKEQSPEVEVVCKNRAG